MIISFLYYIIILLYHILILLYYLLGHIIMCLYLFLTCIRCILCIQCIRFVVREIAVRPTCKSKAACKFSQKNSKSRSHSTGTIPVERSAKNAAQIMV